MCFTVKKIAIVLSIIILCLCLGTAFLLNWEVYIDTSTIPSEIEYGQTIYSPTAYLRGRILFKNGFEINLVDNNKNDFSKTGHYVNHYEAAYLFYKGEKNVDIFVLDKKPPVIELNYIDGHFTIPNEEYVEEGYTANDEYDGDLTGNVVFEIKDGVVYYSVSDSSGNIASVERKIHYHDPIAPVITLNGKSEIKIYKNDKYAEEGATATDNVDGDISEKIQIIGEVDTTTIGTYVLEYKVFDNYNNETTATRTVKVVERPVIAEPVAPGKVIYLTFDDGPSQHTRKLLDILDKYNVKATFFVVGNKGNYDIMREIVNRGHAIGIHSVTHDYSKIYKSEQAFLDDLYEMQQIIKDETGIETYLMRFPGGSSNTVSKKYCKGIMTLLCRKVEELGFRYFDWNVDSNDAGGANSKQEVFNNVSSGVRLYKSSIVLQHDTKGYSVDAVEDIIKWGLENGCTFAALNMSSPTAHHGINN